MPPISWQWKDFWNWFEQVDSKIKTEAMRELNGNGWLANLSADGQVAVFMFAPEEVLLSLKHFPKIIKRETLMILQHEREKKNRRMKRK